MAEGHKLFEMGVDSKYGGYPLNAKLCSHSELPLLGSKSDNRIFQTHGNPMRNFPAVTLLDTEAGRGYAFSRTH